MSGTITVVKGRVALYKRGRSGCWQCRVKLKDGSWHRVSTGEYEVEEATDKALEIHHDMRSLARLNLPQVSKTFRSAARIAINDMKRKLEEGRSESKVVFTHYIAALEQYFIPYFGDYHVDKLNTARMNDFDQWRLEKMNKSEMTQSTLNTHNSAIGRVFKIAIEQGWMTDSQKPSLTIKGKKGKTRPFFSRTDYSIMVRRLRHWAESGYANRKTSTNQFVPKKKIRENTAMIRELLRDYVLMLANTGARHGTEMMNVKWKNIQWFVDKNGIKYIEIYVDGKTGPRTLIARHRVATHLKRIQSRFADLAEMSFDELLRKRVDEYVFRLRDGSQTNAMDKNFQQYLERLNLLYGGDGSEKRTLYSLRHTYATFALEDGVPIAILAKQMGTSVQMIQKHYSKFVPNMAAATLAGPRYGEAMAYAKAEKTEKLTAELLGLDRV